MKLVKFLQFAPVSLLLITASCATHSTMNANSGKRFHDADSTDLVLEYYRPDTIYMKRPDAHEGPFLTIFNRDTIATEIANRVAEHDLAVVVLGQFYDLDLEAAVIKDWQSVLDNCGFNRIVFLRAGRTTDIKGLPIIQDSAVNNTALYHSAESVTTIAAISQASQ